jgi:hypothetical protein
MSTLRFQVLKALEKARDAVARGHPSLAVAFHYMRLTDKEWTEVDRAVDDVRFEPRPAPFILVPLLQRGEPPEVSELRELLEAAQRNSYLPWEDPGGFTRAECVALLSCAIARTKSLPVVGVGPLLPHLPLDRGRA